MTIRDWTYLIFRLLGLFFIILSVLWLPSSLQFIFSLFTMGSTDGTTMLDVFDVFAGVAPWSYLVEFSRLIAYTTIGALLLRKTDWFVETAFRSVDQLYDGRGVEDAMTEEEVDAPAAGAESGDEASWDLRTLTSFDRDAVMTIGVSLVGIIVLALAVPDIVRWLVAVIDGVSTSQITNLSTLLGHGTIEIMMTVAISLWLFFSSHRVVELLYRRSRKDEATLIDEDIEASGSAS